MNTRRTAQSRRLPFFLTKSQSSSPPPFFYIDSFPHSPSPAGSADPYKVFCGNSMDSFPVFRLTCLASLSYTACWPPPPPHPSFPFRTVTRPRQIRPLLPLIGSILSVSDLYHPYSSLSRCFFFCRPLFVFLDRGRLPNCQGMSFLIARPVLFFFPLSLLSSVVL